MSKTKLKPPGLQRGKTISTGPSAGLPLPINYPIFCFRHLHPLYDIEQCPTDDRLALLNRLTLLSRQSWQELQLAPRHGIGCEKIARTSIRPGIPQSIPEHIDFFLAFRYNGRKAVIGWRDTFVFHLLFVDRNFSVYTH